MQPAAEHRCFLLTRQWRDTRGGVELVFWGASGNGPVRVVVRGETPVCFIARDDDLANPRAGKGAWERRALALASLAGEPVDGLYFRQQRDLVAARDFARSRGVHLHESDLKPVDRYLMERFVTAGFRVAGQVARRAGYLEISGASLKRDDYRPALSRISVDVESNGLSGELYSIAVHGERAALVFIVSPGGISGGDTPVRECADERALLGAFFAWVAETDPDLLIGWNVVNFDLALLQRRCATLGIPFAMGRGTEQAAVLEPNRPGANHVARIPGRVVLDGIDCLRAAFWSFESFALDAVARELLGRGKHAIGEPAGRNIGQKVGDGDKVAAINRLYAEAPARLAAYNLEDARLVSEIFDATGLVDFAMRRAELTGLAMDRSGGSVAAFDNLYLPRLHRRGKVAPDVGDTESGAASPGGYVLDSVPGLYDNVLLLDFKSLYPSIIRTFRIDPLGLAAPGEDPVPGFLGASFAREGAILPTLIAELWAVRDEAKLDGDRPLSQAVKILMNSFYGVLGATGCRFSDPRLASSITRRGHEIIRTSRDLIEQWGRQVIYGDTDSLFVLLGDGVGEPEARRAGAQLAAELNEWWRAHLDRELHLESHLEIEFETHYLRFLMPTVRGEQTGSKKRYAGLVRGGDGRREVVFKGLESVRTDWTPLARRFQRELYRRVFLDEPFEEYVQATLAALLAGELDEELVYRKRLRRALDDYTSNAPPHVQAARKLERPGRWVRYVITANGPEPVAGPPPRPDYAHYRERQLAPAADGILHFLGTSFAQLTDKQLTIF